MGDVKHVRGTAWQVQVRHQVPGARFDTAATLVVVARDVSEVVETVAALGLDKCRVESVNHMGTRIVVTREVGDG